MALIKNFERLPFYINYEECKSKYRTTTCTTQFCFILTMRNVNLGALKIKKLSEIGFILTMRNVNTTVVYQLSTPVTGFILTMRNVNYGNANTASQINAVLY